MNDNISILMADLRMISSDRLPDNERIQRMKAVVENAIQANQDALQVIEYLEQVHAKKTTLSN